MDVVWAMKSLAVPWFCDPWSSFYPSSIGTLKQNEFGSKSKHRNYFIHGAAELFDDSASEGKDFVQGISALFKWASISFSFQAQMKK